MTIKQKPKYRTTVCTQVHTYMSSALAHMNMDSSNPVNNTYRIFVLAVPSRLQLEAWLTPQMQCQRTVS